MMSVTAPVLIDAAPDLAEPCLELLVPRVEERGEDGRPRQRPQERLEQQVEQITKKENASVEEQRGASLPCELIRHLLRI